MTITKATIIENLYEYFQHLGYSRKQCVELIESLLDVIKNSLASGEDVLISGFGKFCVNEKNDRKGRNPSTGEEMILPARRVVTFKSSSRLREKVNRDQHKGKKGTKHRRRAAGLSG